MFVRFRKVPNDGFEPPAARDATFTWERRHPRSRRRWVIGREEEEKLVPFSIKVMLVENHRVDGKVKQDIVAALGGIDATWLESFWERMPDPALRCEKWEQGSLQRRTIFWEGVLGRMSQIGDNRLSKDERVAIRRAIHKVVPWVMEPERKRLELLQARGDFETLKTLHTLTEQRIALDEEMAREIAERLSGRRGELAEYAESILHEGLRIAKLSG
jgi:hypothetical protein